MDVDVATRPRQRRVWREEAGGWYNRDRHASGASESYPWYEYEPIARRSWEEPYERLGAYGEIHPMRPRRYLEVAPGLSLAVRGPYAGRGPRGYRRSDERIREDVNEILTRDPRIDATHVQVSVESGEVTLQGRVEDRYQKHLAEDLAAGVNGVVDVHNRLHVDQFSRWETLAAPPGRRDLRENMPVWGADGAPVGRVRQVFAADFVVDRGRAPEVRLPFTAVREVHRGRVLLGVAANDVLSVAWNVPAPPAAGPR